MELMGKVMFCLFTLGMLNYARTIGRYDTHKIRALAYIYMVVAAILAAKA